jgi:tetratricopeptide (TPR) repeat protein
MSGCQIGNPNLATAKEAMGNQEYERALTNIDTAIAQDSTVQAKAYKMRAKVLRQMADSTMAPAEYKDLFRQARAAEDSAIKYDSGLRGELENRQARAYSQQYQKGAKTFRKAQRTADSTAYRQAAAHFGAASATLPDTASTILNESYALLNMERMKQTGDMANAIPVLERYFEKEDEPQKNAYDILSSLYLQKGENQKAIDLLETARKDLSARPTKFNISGSRGLTYTGTVEVDGSSREVEGKVPGEVALDSGNQVSGTFEKQQPKGQLRIQLLYKGSPIKDTTVTTGSATLSATLADQTPLAQLEGKLLNAYNRAGQTEKAMAEYQEQIEENPNNVTYRYNYGSLLLNAERYDDAIEQLKKAVELDSREVKAQYNLGAAYTNKARQLQDSIRAVEDSLSTIRDEAVEANRAPTEEEKEIVNRLDKRSKVLEQRKRNIFKQAIPPLERARQMSESESSIRQDACRALVSAYVQTERIEKARELEECAGMDLDGGN